MPREKVMQHLEKHILPHYYKGYFVIFNPISEDDSGWEWYATREELTQDYPYRKNLIIINVRKARGLDKLKPKENYHLPRKK